MDERHSSLEISISSFFFNLNSSFLVNTGFFSGINFNSFLFSSSVLDSQGSNKLISSFLSFLKFNIFFLKLDFHKSNTFSSFQKFTKSTFNIGLFDINAIPLLFVEILVHLNEGQVTLRSGVDVLTHLLEVSFRNVSYHVMALSHM